MRIAMQVPFKYLEELSPYTDFDYALSHLVLQLGPTSDYVKFYRKQSGNGREVWLDNSIHELGKSVELEDLLEAARIINATHVVAPEVKNDPVRTRLNILKLKEVIQEKGLPYKIVGAWHGFKKDLESLGQICDVVALPFARPRSVYVTRLTSRLYHYFGFRTLDELKRLPPKSIDTSMPIRAALYDIDLSRAERRRRTPPLNFECTLSSERLEKVVKNIQLMRKYAGQ